MIDLSKPWTGGHYSFVVVDVETSGLKQEDGARVVEVAAVLFRPEAGTWGVADRFVSTVKPCDGFVMPEEATAINGITQAMVDAAPSFAEVWPRISAMCEGDVAVVAYAADFDRGHLRAEVMRLGLASETVPQSLKNGWLDPLVWVREVDRYAKGKGRHRLVETCKRWGIPMGEGHTADADAEATGWLLLSQQMRGVISGSDDPAETLPLAQVLHLQRTFQTQQDARFQSFQKSAPVDGSCSSCGAKVVWCETAAGKRMPVDAEPADDGTVSISRVTKVPVAKVLSGEDIELAKAAGIHLHKSHFATCPNAAAHRTPKR